MPRLTLSISALFSILMISPALAHVGHIGEAAGHGHWGGIILIGLAAAIGLWAALKGKKDAKDTKETADEELNDADGELQDA